MFKPAVVLQVGGNTERALVQPDPDSYMLAYREWQHKKNTGDTRQLGSLVDIKVCRFTSIIIIVIMVTFKRLSVKALSALQDHEGKGWTG